MRIAAAAVVVALTAITCSTASERALLDQFFAASRLRDRTALARFSTVVFEPRRDGIVKEFVVLRATRERQLYEHPAFAAGSKVPSEVPAERQRVINLSLADPTDPFDPGQYQTVFSEKDVTVSAQVGLADGTDATRSIVLTLQRARVEDEHPRAGRWIVVRFTY
jgi:hypothetical protein